MYDIYATFHFACPLFHLYPNNFSGFEGKRGSVVVRCCAAILNDESIPYCITHEHEYYVGSGLSFDRSNELALVRLFCSLFHDPTFDFGVLPAIRLLARSSSLLLCSITALIIKIIPKTKTNGSKCASSRKKQGT